MHAGELSGSWFGIVDDNRVYAVDIGDAALSEARLLGRHEGDLIPKCLADDLGRFFLTFDKTGKVKRWDPTGKIAPASLKLPSASYSWGFIPLFLHPDGLLVVISLSAENSFDALLIFALDESGIRLLRRIKPPNINFPAFDPVGPRIADARATSGAQCVGLRRARRSQTDSPESRSGRLLPPTVVQPRWEMGDNERYKRHQDMAARTGRFFGDQYRLQTLVQRRGVSCRRAFPGHLCGVRGPGVATGRSGPAGRHYCDRGRGAGSGGAGSDRRSSFARR